MKQYNIKQFNFEINDTIVLIDPNLKLYILILQYNAPS